MINDISQFKENQNNFRVEKGRQGKAKQDGV